MTDNVYAHRTIALAGREPDQGTWVKPVTSTMIDSAIWTAAADACGWPNPTDTYDWSEWA